jgi:hypothetical protein
MLIGLERERHKGTGERRGSAGLRTFAISVAGLRRDGGGAALLVGIVAIGLTLLITVAYWRGRDDDPGVTSEVALIIVLILGALYTLTRTGGDWRGGGRFADVSGKSCMTSRSRS